MTSLRKVNSYEARVGIDMLKEAISELEIYLDPNNKNCDVRKDMRGEGPQLYLGSWVLGPLQEALRLLEGRDPE